MGDVCLVMNQCDTVFKSTYVHRGCLQSLRDLYMVVETIKCSEAVSRSHWMRHGVTTVTMGHKCMAVAGKNE